MKRNVTVTSGFKHGTLQLFINDIQFQFIIFLLRFNINRVTRYYEQCSQRCSNLETQYGKGTLQMQVFSVFWTLKLLRMCQVTILDEREFND